jgi:hypothetical protein
MQNHPRISAGSQLGICPFTPQVLHQHLQLSPFALGTTLSDVSLVRI